MTKMTMQTGQEVELTTHGPDGDLTPGLYANGRALLWLNTSGSLLVNTCLGRSDAQRLGVRVTGRGHVAIDNLRSLQQDVAHEPTPVDPWETFRRHRLEERTAANDRATCRIAARVLSGAETPYTLPQAFTWEHTAQGYSFWSDVACAATLTREGKDALAEVLDQLMLVAEQRGKDA